MTHWPPDSLLAAHQAYYAAFRAADIEQMMQVWAERPDIVCVHPGSPKVHRGVAEVMESWLIVFSRELSIGINPRIVSQIEHSDVGWLLIEEAITRPGDTIPTGSMFLSQGFRCLGGAWYLVHHHASQGRRPSVQPQSTYVPGTESRLRH